MEECTCPRALKIVQCSYMISAAAAAPTLLCFVFRETNPAVGSEYKTAGISSRL